MEHRRRKQREQRRTGADAKDEKEQQQERQPKQVDLLLQIADGLELICDTHGEAFARIPAAGHTEVRKVRSDDFRAWLCYRFYELHGRAPGNEALGAVVNTLQAKARLEARRQDVHVRVAPGGDGVVYVDLGDPEWKAIRITTTGFGGGSHPSGLFWRPNGTLELPYPDAAGDLETLRRFVNVDDEGWVLLKAWLVAALVGTGPCPVLVFCGEQGCAKSTATKMVRALIDPRKPEARSLPRQEQDLAIAAQSAWVLAIDNVSRVPVWLSDALCRIVTGAGFCARRLYTDADEIILEARRPCVLNGIGDFVTRGDLIDRALIIRLRPIPETGRRTEAELWEAFRSEHPSMLGGLLNRVSGALRELPIVVADPPPIPRMADFAYLALAAERAAGETGFLATYAENHREGEMQAIESDQVAEHLVRMAHRQEEWVGTCGELLGKLEQAIAAALRDRGWPRTPRALASHLERVAPALRRNGVEVERLPRTSGQRPWRVRSAPPSPGGPHAGDQRARERDGGDDGSVLSDGDRHGRIPVGTMVRAGRDGPDDRQSREAWGLRSEGQAGGEA